MTETDTEHIDALARDAQDDIGSAEEQINDIQSLANLGDELQEAKDGIQKAVDIIQGVSDDLYREEDRLEGASQRATSAREIMSALRDDLTKVETDGDVRYEGKLVTGSGVYRIEVREDPDEGFDEWLARQISTHSRVTIRWLASESLASDDRIHAILDGDEPKGDEGKSIVKTLHEAGLITEQEHDRVRERYFEGDDTETLADLFG